MPLLSLQDFKQYTVFQKPTNLKVFKCFTNNELNHVTVGCRRTELGPAGLGRLLYQITVILYNYSTVPLKNDHNHQIYSILTLNISSYCSNKVQKSHIKVPYTKGKLSLLHCISNVTAM